MKIRKEIVVAAVFALGSGSAMAGANVGSCGWGSKVFDGQSGIAPQVLAVTTNGTSGNQTFAITSGTSGCTQDGTVTTNWAAMYIDGNKDALARASAAGQGEALDALASTIGVAEQDKAAFAQLAQDNFAAIFPSSDVSTDHVVSALRTALQADTQLSKYATAI